MTERTEAEKKFLSLAEKVIESAKEYGDECGRAAEGEYYIAWSSYSDEYDLLRAIKEAGLKVVEA